jgi:septum site-determining protein MinD
LSDALLIDERLDTLHLLPASRTRGKEALTEDGVGRVISELGEQFDWVLCDSPAGIERGAMLAMRFADEAIIVVNPEISSVRDSSRILGLVDSKPLKVEAGGRLDRHMLITRFDPARVACGEMLSVDDVREVLPVPLLGIIPESEDVLRASNLGAPLTVCGRESAVSRAYLDAARRIKGDWVEITVPGKNKSLLTKLLGRRAA